MHNEYVGTLPGKNLGDVWRRSENGEYVCGHRNYTVTEKGVKHDVLLGYLKPLGKHHLIYINKNKICFIYESQGYKITKDQWYANRRLGDVWPTADCYIRIIGHLASGVFQEFFDKHKYNVALA